MKLSTHSSGFTLAELLICMAILGVIATFTIPKIVQAQQNQTYTAEAKDAMAAVAGAYQVYRLQNAASTNTTFGDVTPYMNYVSADNSLWIDDVTSFGAWSCASFPCLHLHSGGVLAYEPASFGADDFIRFWYDPDGVYSGTTNGPGKSLSFILYTNGRMPQVFSTPSWFQW